MNKQEFYKYMQKIETAYNKKFTQEEARMWYEEFQNVSVEEFEKAIDQIIKTNKFLMLLYCDIFAQKYAK